jgi:hypothetical protein
MIAANPIVLNFRVVAKIAGGSTRARVLLPRSGKRVFEQLDQRRLLLSSLEAAGTSVKRSLLPDFCLLAMLAIR